MSIISRSLGSNGMGNILFLIRWKASGAFFDNHHEKKFSIRNISKDRTGTPISEHGGIHTRDSTVTCTSQTFLRSTRVGTQTPQSSRKQFCALDFLAYSPYISMKQHCIEANYPSKWRKISRLSFWLVYPNMQELFDRHRRTSKKFIS